MQHKNILDKNFFLCHHLSVKHPLNSLKSFRMYWRYLLHLIHNLDNRVMPLGVEVLIDLETLKTHRTK